MLTCNELWEKCKNNQTITADDLGINPIRRNCGIVVYCGSRTFYTDGINYYDEHGNLASDQIKRKYDLR